MTDFMGLAARLATDGVVNGEGGPFGAVVVKDGQIVAAARNRVLATNDPTAHAEILALREAGRTLGSFDLGGCVLYTTCEPCPMCLAAVHWARIEKVVYSQTRDDAAAAGFDDAKLHDGLDEVALEHAPHADAATAFEIWNKKADRTGY